MTTDSGLLSTRLGYALVDADNHYYEPRDAFTRHLPRSLHHLAVRPVDTPKGERIMVGDRPLTFLHHDYDRVPLPGGLRAMLQAMKRGASAMGATGAAGADAPTADEPVRPEYLHRDARIARMDDQGVEAAILFPTLGVCVEHSMVSDPVQLYANLEAFNRYVEDDWGYGADGRIFAAAMVSLVDLDRAVRELDRVLALGARVLALRPGPAAGRSPADPCFDPFWARVAEAGAVVGLHIGESGYNELYSTAWGERPNPSSHRQSALQWTCFYGDRPIMETLAAMVLHNLFGRFPSLRVASVENGSLFVPYLFAVLDKMKGMGRNGPWPGGYVAGRPSEILKQHLYVAPFHEEDVVALTRAIGADRVLFGSDFPHPEGLAEPVDFADAVAVLPDDDVRRIMRDNAASLLGIG
jgi:predicted TIM-barrel fold metal-dependent hydrolase